MIFGKCSDCCKVCCCIYNDESNQNEIVRTKSKQQCEKDGGTVVPCPDLGLCPCTCTATVTMGNGFSLPIVDDAFSVPDAVEIAIAETETSVCTNGWDATRWRFVGAAQYSCILFGVEVNWVRLVVWPQLWGFNGVDWVNISAATGSGSVGSWYQDWFTPYAFGWIERYQQAVDICALVDPILQDSSYPGGTGNSPDNIPGFPCTSRIDWLEELIALAAPLFPPTIAISCTPPVVQCEVE